MTSCLAYDRVLPTTAVNGWRLPSKQDFENMIGTDGCKSADNLRQLKGRQANSCASDTDGIWTMKTDEGYWSSIWKEDDAYYNLWEGNCDSYDYKDKEKYVRPCFTFSYKEITCIDHNVSGEGTNTTVTEVVKTVDTAIFDGDGLANFIGDNENVLIDGRTTSKTVVFKKNHTYNNPIVIWGTVNFILTIGSKTTVWAGTETTNNRKPAADRVGACQYNSYAKIAECDHNGSTITIDDGFTHHHDGCDYCSVASGAKQDHAFNDASKCICGLVSLKDDADNAATITTFNETHLSVTLTGRKLWKDNSWNTICLPFAVSDFSGTPLEGATVKTLSSASFNSNTGTLTLNFSDDLTAIDAGKPYIVKWGNTGNPIENPLFKDVNITSTIPADIESEAANFHGIYSKRVWSSSSFCANSTKPFFLKRGWQKDMRQRDEAKS